MISRVSIFNLALLLCLSGTSITGLAATTPAAPMARESQEATQMRRATLAILDLGTAEIGRRAAEHLSQQLMTAGGAMRVVMLDRELARSAARGIGYAGSLNLTLAEARDLGAAVGCDFYLAGDAQVVRRSSSERPVYFEAYVTLFLVSARTGRLINWSRPAAEAATPERAEAALFALLDGDETTRLLASIGAALDGEARELRTRADSVASDPNEEVIDLTSGQTFEGLREPAPYNRLRPAYTEAASRAEAVATVDVEVEIGANGRVGDVRIIRWAGFGLDEEVAATVRRMNFRPATIDGEPRPSRVILRYNFRRPPPAAK
jgi:TonB family protein